MALIILPNGVPSSEITISPDHHDHRLLFFKLISEDIIENIFSRLENDVRHLSRLACVCRKFSNVVRNVSWKRLCTTIVPELMPSPDAKLDQLAEPPGGWGALMKLLVCCPGLKHAGLVADCWDFGLERELGPSELYEVQPRYYVKPRVEVEFVSGTGSVGKLTPAAGDTSLLCHTEQGASAVGADPDSVTGSEVEKLTATDENGKSLAHQPSPRVEESVPLNRELSDSKEGYSRQCSVKRRVEVDSVSGTRSSGELTPAAGDTSLQCSTELSASAVGADQKSATGSELEKLTVTEENGKSSARAEASVQLNRELNDSIVSIDRKVTTGSSVEQKLAATGENCKSSGNPSVALKVLEIRNEIGRPPKVPVRSIRWKEEEGNLKAENGGSKLQPVTDSGKQMSERGRSRKRKERALRKLSKAREDPKQQPHLASGDWKLSREQGSRLLASRFRCDSLYVCDWPGCVHPGEKRNYKLFRGFFKNFKTSLLWRNLKDMRANPTNTHCAFCSSPSTWDMMTAFCLRRSFEYHDDGEPVVHAYVCENGHVAGAWTDRPGVYPSL